MSSARATSRPSEPQRRAHDALTCRLCTQYMVDPRQLPCGHSFCLRCLEAYYDGERRRGADRPGSRRSPSVDRRPRTLLPCPAAPVCLHVAVVPDDGVAGFPVNVNMEDMKERVVNEMAANISRRIGLSPSGTRLQSDTESVYSDSCESTASAPAGSATAGSSGPPRYPNLAKYAKYFEAESGTDGSGSPLAFTPSRRSDRRRVPMSSSFQHRRRRVAGTASPAPATAFDDLTGDDGAGGRQPPSRCGSAPHLDSMAGDTGMPVYRPTVRRRQGSATASPLLLRRTRPTSCILEELAPDTDELFKDELQRPSETLRRAASTDRQRQPLVREHIVLPTHRENISLDDERSMPPSSRYFAPLDEERRSVPTPSETSRHSSLFDRAEPSHRSPAVTTSHAEEKPPKTLSPKPSKRSMSEVGESVAASHGSATAARTEEKPNKTPTQKLHKRTESESNESVTAKPSAVGRGRRVLPSVPSEQPAVTADTSRTGSTGASSGVEPPKDSTSADPHRRRHLPRTDVNTAGSGTQSRDPNSSKNSSAKSPSEGRKSRSSTKESDTKRPKTPDSGLSLNSSRQSRQPPGLDTPRSSYGHRLNSTKKPQPSSTDRSDSERQQTRGSSRLSSTVPNSMGGNPGRERSDASNPAQTKPSSASNKSSHADSSKSSQSQSKSSASDVPVRENPDRSRKFSAGDDVSRTWSGSVANSGKDHRDKQPKSAVKSPSNLSGTVPSQSPRSARPSQTEPQSKDKLTQNSEKSVRSGNKSKSARSSEKPSESFETSSGPGMKGRSTRSSGKPSESFEKTPGGSGSSSRSGRSSGGSGSRLTYKVNAATVHPIFMNRNKTKPNRDSMSSDDFDLDSVDINIAAPPSSGSSTTPGRSNMDMENSTSHPRNVADVETGSPTSTRVDLSCSSEMPTVHLTSETGLSIKTDNNSDVAPASAAAAGDVVISEAAKKKAEEAQKKAEQWAEFTATLQAARTKYSSPATHTAASETPRSGPVYHDTILPRWRIHRDDFAVPTSLLIASDGSAVIADISHCVLDFVDADGNVTHSLTGTKPFSVATGSGSDNGHVYVGDRRSRTVRVFDVYGSDVAQWDAETTSFGWIAGIAVLRNGHLAIVDRERCKVGVYTAGGERVTEFGSYGTRDSQLCMADFLAVDLHGRVVVADSGNHRLQLFDPGSGKLVGRVAGDRGENPTDGVLLWPKGVAIDEAGQIIVADSGHDRVCRFSEDGRYIDNLVSGTVKPYHVTCGCGGLMGVTQFTLSGTSQVDVYAVESPG